MKKSNKEEFIKKSKIIHGNKYDYSNVEYINSKKKVKIICPEHGEFNQTPASHTIGSAGCPKCSRKNIKYKRSGVIDTETFIKKSKEIHGDKNLKKNVNKTNGKTNSTFGEVKPKKTRSFRLFKKRKHKKVRTSKKTDGRQFDLFDPLQIKNRRR